LKSVPEQIFSPAQAVDEKVLLLTVPNLDVPALLGHEPNTSLAFQ